MKSKSAVKKPAPIATQRRRNREALKTILLKEQCGTESSMCNQILPNIVISDELKQKLSRGFILEDDIFEVISYCEMSGNKVKNMKSDTFLGHRKIGHVTYWVKYRFTKGAIELINAYSHRIAIEEQQYGRCVYLLQMQ